MKVSTNHTANFKLPMFNISSFSMSGFTMAELLVALTILGVIATFSIPKILNASTNGKLTAITKEAASMIGGAFSVYTLNNTLSTTDTGGALTPYMNYTSVDTATHYTAGYTGDTQMTQCAATLPCLKLHNGGILQYDTVQTFGSTASPGGVVFDLDPDNNGTRGIISFIIYANGHLSTGGVNTPTVTHGTAGTIALQGTDPTFLTNWN